jgi:hypothetical protein
MFWLALLVGCSRVQAPVATVPTTRTSQPSVWQTFESTEGRFSVLFPGPHRKQITKSPEHRAATAYICAVPGNRSFMVVFEDPPEYAEQLAKAPPLERARMIQEGLEDGLDGTLKAAKQVLSRESSRLARTRAVRSKSSCPTARSCGSAFTRSMAGSTSSTWVARRPCCVRMMPTGFSDRSS